MEYLSRIRGFNSATTHRRCNIVQEWTDIYPNKYLTYLIQTLRVMLLCNVRTDLVPFNRFCTSSKWRQGSCFFGIFWCVVLEYLTTTTIRQCYKIDTAYDHISAIAATLADNGAKTPV